MKGNSSLYSSYSFGGSSFSSSSLHGNSQPYKEQYAVYSKMMKKDIKSGVYNPSNGGYIKNPTAKNLKSLYNGNYIVGPNFNIDVPYVITKGGEVVIGKRNGFGRENGALPTPHPTLIGGTDPKVRMAGILSIRNGKILSYDDRSGHFRPNVKSMKWADDAFKKYPKHEKFKGGK